MLWGQTSSKTFWRMVQVEEEEVLQLFELIGDRSKADEVLWGGFAQERSQYTRNHFYIEPYLACQSFFAIMTPRNEATNDGGGPEIGPLVVYLFLDVS